MRYRQQYRSRLSADALISRLEQRIGELGMEKLGMELAGSDTTQIDRRLADLEKRRSKRAAGLGLAPHRCVLCRDTGYTDGDFCTCVRRRIYHDHYGLRELDGAGPSISNYPLDVLDGRMIRSIGSSARRLAELGTKAFRDLIANYPNSGRGILLVGFAGVGKTYMALAAAREAASRGIDVLFIHAGDLNNLYLRQRLGENVDMHYLETSRLLIVDDLGTEPQTRNVTRESLDHLLEVRAAGQLPTVFTTNLADLQPIYGERLSSRLNDKRRFQYLQLGGVDLRTGRDHTEDRGPA